MNKFNSTTSFLSSAERAAIAKIEGTTDLLQLITRIKNLKFAAFSESSEDNWIACSVLDELYLGVSTDNSPPEELKLCRQLKGRQEALIFPNSKLNDLLLGHDVAVKYEIGSYVAFPIILSDGKVYGTLCTVGAKPSTTLEDVVMLDTLYLFSKLLANIIEAHTIQH